MSKLESLVPAFARCQRIPKNAYKKTALVWAHNGGFVTPRTPDAAALGRVPAPTLEEIIKEVEKESLSFVVISRWLKSNRQNAANVALKVWFEMIRGEHK